jgi:hypothetical protein
MFSGIVKAVDPVGGGLKVEEYLNAFGLAALNPLAVFIAVSLAAFEFMLGSCLLVAVYRRLTTILMLAFMAFMTLLTLYIVIFNPVHDCGCFGDALILTNSQTFFKDLLLLLPAAVGAYAYYDRMTPFFTCKAYRLAALFSCLFPVGFAWYNYNHLPVEDFRPYKIGANIPALMAFPEDAPQDEYRYVYERSGERKAFTPETSPAGDSTWRFVEAQLVRQGYVPPVTSFELYDEAGNNMADSLLAAENGVFLLVSPDLEKASDEQMDEINSLYDYARERRLSFYCVTSSSTAAIRTWIRHTGAEYPFLTADDVTLKTMIRSNPGLVLMKAGTILAKWHCRDIPAEEETDAVISRLLRYPDEMPEGKNTLWVWIWITGCFALPLLLVRIYDDLRNRKKNDLFTLNK